MLASNFRWLASVLVGVVVGVLATAPAQSPTAWAQQGADSAGGLFAIEGMTDAGVHLLFLVDRDRRSLGVYEYDPRKTKLRLAAVRQFGADLELAEFNNEPPNVENIRMLVRQR